MKCPKCQTENPDKNSFCCECGIKLSFACPQCQAEVFADDKFCGKCGHAIQKIREALPIDFNQPQSYTPKFLADKILTTRSSIEGERKLVTVLFADVANYTAMAEKLDPEEAHQIMDRCFKILMEEIHRYEGTINQFTGDGVMALFGAPVAHEDHAQRACYAALSIQKAIGKYGEKVKKETGVNFRMRIGLNSGQVIVGSIGDDLRMDYTAVGDTTNLAARMENAAKPGSILVSTNTHRLVRDFFEFESLGKVAVKGKEAPQEAFKLIKSGEVETRIGASVAKGLTRFVGRKNSMAAVMKAFKKAKSGSGQVLAIVGEAGVGKSRLLLEMRNRLPQDKTIYLEGRCIHFGGSMAYLPILDILRSYFGIQEEDREYIIKKKMKEKVVLIDEKLDSLLPPLQELLSLTVDDDAFSTLEPKKKRGKTFEALRDLLIRISHGKPLVIAIEDLHWIDKTTEEFLDYLIGWLANTTILLILLYRPEYTHQWGSKSYYTQVGLDQLGAPSSTELIKAILEEGEVAPELKQLILDRATGNPLFMEEFTHTLIENGSIEKRNEQYVLNRKPSEIQVPDTIQGIIAARMDRLEDNIKRTMQVASVIGKDFAFRILQTITGMHEELKSYLLNLQGLEFIYEKRLFPELEYIFKHALTQEVAYNSLLQKKRKEIHEKIGGAIEKIYAERLEEFYEMLAYHYLKSENAEKAYHYLKLSGDKAVKNYANREAFRFYKEAIDVLSKMPETEENKRKQIDVRLSLWPPMHNLGYPEDSLKILQDGERISEEIKDERSLAIFYSKLSNYYVFKGDPLLGVKYCEKGFQEAAKIEDVDVMAPIAIELSVAYTGAGEFSKMPEMAFRVISLLEKTHKESEFFGRPFNVYPELHGHCGYSLARLGKFSEGEALCEKGLRFAQGMNHFGTLGVVELLYSWLFVVKGDGENAINHSKNCIKYFEEGDVPVILPWAWSLLGTGHYYSGEFETALKHVQKGLKMQKDVGITMFLSWVYHYMGMIHLGLGEFKSAQHCAEKSLNLAQENHEKHIEGMSWISLGRIVGKKEPPKIERAEEYILKGIKILDELKLKPLYAPGYHFLGELHADVGKHDKALENLKKAEGMFKEMGMDYYLTKTLEALGRL